MNRLMARIVPALAVAGVVTVAVPLPSDVSVAAPSSDARSPAAQVMRTDTTTALVELKGEPLATSTKTAPPKGKKVDFTSNAVKSYRAQLAAQRNDFKQWLRQNAPRARVTSEFDVGLNAVAVQLNGTSLDALRTAPMVASAEYQGLYRPTAHEDPDLDLIDALEAWRLAPAGETQAGQGVKIAIIDTGIDIRHPCFDDAGYPEDNAPDNVVNGGTNDKVIHAEAFYNKLDKSGFGTADLNGHGTHVAGTAACNAHTPAWIDDPSNGPVDIPYDPSGVAPGAMLGNFNVFPGTLASARSEDILNALQRAFELGFDVANMSLGGGSQGVQDLLSQAVNRFDRGGMVIAIAAGNEGPGDETVESPGFAERAITAGASSVGHFVGTPLVVGDASYGLSTGAFPTAEEDVTAPIDVVTEGTTNPVTGIATACTPLPPGSLSGEIAVISRGDCTFSLKSFNAEQAGAIAVIIVNNVAGDPVGMASDGTPNQPTVPVYMIGLADGLVLKTQDGVVGTIEAHLEYFNTENDNIVASFSGRGPTDVNFRVKPDVVAPGLNVLSSRPAEACEQTTPLCWAFLAGTSMATPHISGSAAVVIDQHPDWTSADVRSAIVNTAVRGVLRNTTTGELLDDDDPNFVNIVGAGLENLFNAVNASISLDPVSLAFGGVPSGSGQNRSGEILIKNLTDATATFEFSIDDPTAEGAVYTVTPSTVTLDAGETATIRVDADATRGNTLFNDWAWLEVSMDGTEVAHAVLYTRTR
jgi:minor extracellular serine protease Vpr